MDRRGYRSVSDPKVRQVGFVTPGAADQGNKGAAGGAAEKEGGGAGIGSLGISSLDTPSATATSPSPVIIPPGIPPAMRPNADVKSAPASTTQQADLPFSSKRDAPPPPIVELPASPLGTNPPDSVPGKFPTSSTPKRKGVAGGGGGQEEKARDKVQEKPQEKSQEKSQEKPPGKALDESVRKPPKTGTSKAERREIQEAQRAAKAASRKAAGIGGGGGHASKTEGGDSHPGGSSSAQKDANKASSSKQSAAATAAIGVGSSSKDALQRKPSFNSEKSPSETQQPSSSKAQDKKKKNLPAPPRMQFDDEQQVAKAKKRALVEQTETKNRVELFRHLPQFVHGTMLPSLEVKYFPEDAQHPHPAIYEAGLQFLTGDVVGGNARCVVMLMAFSEMIADHTTPPEKIFNRDLTAKINSQVSFLTTCRPLAISMGNAIKFLKSRVVDLVGTLPENEAKASLIVDINRFIQEKILYADKEIVRHAIQKIRDGDVCLTFGMSSVVELILLQAHQRGTKFRVVVVDSRPKLEGKVLLKRLLREGIDCTYTYINGVSYVMQEVTRVFLGAAAVLSNGTVYSRVGTASVAMVAHALSVPVMFCCETYKFHERVQLDSITANELGDPDVLVDVCGRSDLEDLKGWADDKHLQLLNLIYDATPSDYVSMIITELGMVPPTSVPVILREYRRDSTI